MSTSAEPSTLAGALRRWLPRQRWYSGRGRAPDSVRVTRLVPLIIGDPGLIHAIVATDRHEHYQLLLGRRTDLPARLADSWICDADGAAIYAATDDDELMSGLLTLFSSEARAGWPRFELTTRAALPVRLPSRVITAEQTNTSLVFGDRYILKLFRRVQPGPHPEIELHRALHRAGSGHIADVIGIVHGELGGHPAALGILQEYLRNARDGWAMATGSANAATGPPDAFAAHAEDLGRSVAEVHTQLAAACGTDRAGVAGRRAEVSRMHRRLTAAVAAAPELAAYSAAARAVFDHAAAERPGARAADFPLQRIHGDLHLGQLLLAEGRWRLIDFEGEPGTPLAERAAPRHALQDVATMLRSFDYAAHHHLFTAGAPVTETGRARARNWAAHTRAAFCAGYAQVRTDPRAEPALLRALELDKAVYEFGYERAHRPEWTAIPLNAIRRIIEGSPTP